MNVYKIYNHRYNDYSISIFGWKNRKNKHRYKWYGNLLLEKRRWKNRV